MKRRNHLGDLDVGGIIILKRILDLCEEVDLIQLTQHRHRLQGLVSMIMDFLEIGVAEFELLKEKSSV
jgi:hypothetical protein